MIRDIVTVYLAWKTAHRDLSANTSLGQFLDIVTRYREPHRFYHTLAHIAACLRFLARTYPNLHPQKRSVLVMAIIYHDIIYDVKSKTNEAESAAHARIQMSVMGFAKTFVDEVVRLIILTAHHKGDPTDILGSIMIDTDMHVFAEPDAVYARYADDIRKEYEPLAGREAFIAGRRNFLSTVDAENIFVTSEMKTEKSASQSAWNIAEEYRKLS